MQHLKTRPQCVAQPSGWQIARVAASIVAPSPSRRSRRLPCAHASVDGSQQAEPSSTGSSSRRTLSALDSLLGQEEADPASAQSSSEAEMVEWWKVKPRQAAPPRQTGMAEGSHGRFVMSEDFLKLGELRVGRKTTLGSQIEIPRVQPILSFVLFIVNVAVFGTYVNVGVLQGPGAALDFLSGLWLHPMQLLQGLPEQLAHAGTSMFMAPGPCELVVALWSLAFVAPKAEAVLGYLPFTAVYLLCGVTGGLVQLSTMHDARYTLDSLGACGASAAICGLLGVLLVHHARNWRVESEAASWRPDTTQPPSPQRPAASISSSQPASSSSGQQPQPASHQQQQPGQQGQQSPTRQQLGQQQLLVQAVCVGVVSLALAGMQALEGGAPSDPGGGAGLWGEVAYGVGVLPQLTGFAAGMLLCAGLGPQYALQREIDLPVGSMAIPDPDNVEETVVVLDRTTSAKRVVTAAAFTLALLGAWGTTVP